VAEGVAEGGELRERGEGRRRWWLKKREVERGRKKRW